MERDGITGYRKLTEEDREKMQQIAKKMGYKEVDQ
jgi:ABC-type thiamine transport system ATPase subunit